MSPSPQVIDGLQFARNGSALRGTLAPDRFPRLAEIGCQVQGAGVAFHLAGGIGRTGKPVLRLEASAQLGLVCQRCLGPLAMPLSVQAELELSDDMQDIARADDDVDRALASPAMSVAELVEDELMLALPQTPKHESCVVSQGGEDASTKRSPFEALARLRQGKGA